MKKNVIKNVSIENTFIDKLYIITDDIGDVIVLALLWTLHLANVAAIYGWKKVGKFNNVNGLTGRRPRIIERIFEARDASQNTIDNYVGCLFQFIIFINSLNKRGEKVGIHDLHLINSRIINHYLNEVLPQRLDSYESLSSHQAAISAFFNFLFEMEIKEYLPSIIYQKTRQHMAEKDTRVKKTSYISKADRVAMLRLCNIQKDSLLLRNGGEVGLRTSENVGLLLEVNKAKGHSQKGLLDLFAELSTEPQKHSFEYVLSGRYTKRQRTRSIFFDRELLTAMKKYHDTERAQIMQETGEVSNHLFVRSDKEGKGLPIGVSHGSNVFRKIKRECTWLNQELSYQDLRHTFATELYHAELLDSNGNETRSESAALTVVGERLGHARGSAISTKRYIRLRQQMLAIEEGRYY